mmetsp:Transcript_56780/g.164730  ORF Transcript_56780/g.164730 Transcript_56780/m.164730 type:complete len:232 (-) Transcript_56780:609-1304(-)
MALVQYTDEGEHLVRTRLGVDRWQQTHVHLVLLVERGPRLCGLPDRYRRGAWDGHLHVPPSPGARVGGVLVLWRRDRQPGGTHHRVRLGCGVGLGPRARREAGGLRRTIPHRRRRRPEPRGAEDHRGGHRRHQGHREDLEASWLGYRKGRDPHRRAGLADKRDLRHSGAQLATDASGNLAGPHHEHRPAGLGRRIGREGHWRRCGRVVLEPDGDHGRSDDRSNRSVWDRGS